MNGIPGLMVCLIVLMDSPGMGLLQSSAGTRPSGVTLTEILGRPTDHSVTLSALFDQQVYVNCEYGLAPGEYSGSTEVQLSVAGQPVVSVLSSLLPNTRYYYCTRYRRMSDTAFVRGLEHTFHTQRSRGATYSFTIQADSHPYDKKGNHTLLSIALRNQLADSADFLLDLGDTFGDDHNPFTITNEEIRQLHLDWRSYFGITCHSSPLFLCLGNHEGESGYYLLQNPPNNLAVYATLWREYYFANPVPDDFYTGNISTESYGIGHPQNYYAWGWGDALFVVIDAYRYYTTSAKPRGWDWTIGKAQYDWFKQILENSTAKFKFVFAHHTLGETRGGVATAKLYEWGGCEADGQTWGFNTYRTDWPMPIHQLMVANGVTVYFQGHDHLFAKEELDGVVYQEVPMPSDSTYSIGMNDNGDAYTGVKLDGSGHLRVTVAPESTMVTYVESRLPADVDAMHWNGRAVYSYVVKSKITSVQHQHGIPTEVRLEQNFPNPFNPMTKIGYAVGVVSRQWSVASQVRLAVYDLLGREVAVLVNEKKVPGNYEVQFDASRLSSGVYVYRLSANGVVETRKALLLR
jgi:hypothetical protein